jgi:hypothetical protein
MNRLDEIERRLAKIEETLCLSGHEALGDFRVGNFVKGSVRLKLKLDDSAPHSGQ